MYTLSSVFEMFPKWIALLLCIFITTFAVSSCLKKVQAGKKTVTVNGVKKIVTVKKIFVTLREDGYTYRKKKIVKGSREHLFYRVAFMCSDCFHLNKYVWVYADVTVLNIDREEEDEYEVEHFPLQYEHFCQPKRRKNPFGFLRAAQFFQAQKLTAIIRKGKTVKIRVLCQKKEKLLRAATSAL